MTRQVFATTLNILAMPVEFGLLVRRQTTAAACALRENIPREELQLCGATSAKKNQQNKNERKNRKTDAIASTSSLLDNMCGNLLVKESESFSLAWPSRVWLLPASNIFSRTRNR